jgi:hypothetical protein
MLTGVSDPKSHLVAVGARVAEALPLVDALLAQSDPRHEVTVELTVAAGSRAVSAYRAMTPSGARVNYELRIPAQHATEYFAVLDPLIVDDALRRGPGLWYHERDGGLEVNVHDIQHTALDALTGLPEVPVEITVTEFPLANMNHGLVPAETDPMRAGVEWTAWWPPVPELGLPPHLKHAAVQLFVNSSGLWDLAPAEPGFRVYVVTGRRDGEETRAAHLAASAGLASPCPPERP